MVITGKKVITPDFQRDEVITLSVKIDSYGAALLLLHANTRTRWVAGAL